MLMNSDDYLKRIGFSERPIPNASSLKNLQVAHMRTVPFENLDIGLGRPILLNLPYIYDKIVRQQRGGLCYELNSLLGWLLCELGYQVTQLSAQAPNNDGSFGQEYDHMLLSVICPGETRRWLVDVGSYFETPIEIDAIDPQSSGRLIWRLECDDNYYLVRQQREGGEWFPHYRFTMNTRGFDYFKSMWDFVQTSPQSIFTQKKFCTILTPDGRVKLSNKRLVITRNGVKEEQDVSEDEIPAMLKQYFGLVL